MLFIFQRIFVTLLKILPIFFFLGISVKMPFYWFTSFSIILVITMIYNIKKIIKYDIQKKILIATVVLIAAVFFFTINTKEALGLYFFYIQILYLTNISDPHETTSPYFLHLNNHLMTKQLNIFLKNKEKKIFPIVALLLMCILLFIVYLFLFETIYNMMLQNNNSMLMHFIWMFVIFITLIFYCALLSPILTTLFQEKMGKNYFLIQLAVLNFLTYLLMSSSEMNFIKKIFSF